MNFIKQKRWQEAETEFKSVLDIPGYERDKGATLGIKISHGKIKTLRKVADAKDVFERLHYQTKKLFEDAKKIKNKDPQARTKCIVAIEMINAFTNSTDYREPLTMYF